jgi:hypothetical protein
MTPKIYLRAQPANEGARRLVWLLLDRDLRARGQLHRRQCSDAMIERLVCGEVTPGMVIGTAIHLVSEGAIEARHWNSPPAAGWFDRPVDWPTFGASADAERLAA